MEYTKNIKVGDTVMFTSTSMQEACRTSFLSSILYKDLIKHPYGVVRAKGCGYFLVEFEGIHYATSLCNDGSGLTLLLRKDQGTSRFPQLKLGF